MIVSIEGTYRIAAAEALYQALMKVFDIPPRSILLHAEEVNQWRSERWEESEVFHGPAVYYEANGDIFIETDVSMRKIYLEHERGSLRSAFIVFPKGSVCAAGEVLAGVPETLWDYIIVDDGERTMWASEYEGPVHKELGRVRWDPKFREAHPDLVYAVLEAEQRSTTSKARK